MLRPRDATDSQRGYSMVELSIAMVIIPIILAAGIIALRMSSELGTTVVQGSASLQKLQSSLRRIGDELLCSGQLGEDLNDNMLLDPGEDTNNNARLERDWLVTANSIRFNRVQLDGTWSPPITYALLGDQLVRTWVTPAGDTVSTTVASSVIAFSVLATDRKINISLSVGDAAAPVSSSIAITQRN
ncbi:MAG: hypothetical protein Fur0037_06650 [Planctomycetota bacterium]